MNFVGWLQKNCIEQTSGREISLPSAHNAMVLYTLNMLSFATAHRAVTDPFSDLSAFNLEERVVLIQDKVVSATHETRLAWLSNSAISQLYNYIEHLRALSRRLKGVQSNLADQIWAVTETGFPHPLPLFFLLAKDENEELTWSRIQPANLIDALGDNWKLPLNTNRHILSTWLHEHDCPPELIDAQLGHVDVGCAPFSRRSTLSPSQAGKILTLLLEEFLNEHGWQPIAGIKAPSRFPIIPPNPRSKLLKPERSFGPTARSVARENTLHHDVNAVAELCNHLVPANPSRTIPDAEIDTLQDRLMSEAPAGRLLIRLALLRRHLLKLKRKGVSVKIPGRLALGLREPSPFRLTSATTATELVAARERFLEYLAKQEGSAPTQERRIAEILISASIFGAQSAPVFCNNLSSSLSTGSYLIDGRLSVDISSSPTAPVRRWFPDRVSEALLIGYWKLRPAFSAPPAPDALDVHLSEILQSMGIAISGRRAGRNTSVRANISARLASLHRLSRAWWLFLLPGSIRAYAEGENPCASIPLDNWLRLITGGKGALNGDGQDSSQPASVDDVQFVMRSTLPTDYNAAATAWKAIKGGFSSKSGKSKGEKVDERSNAHKAKIVAAAQAFLNNEENQAPSIALLVAQWIIHLCRHGTPYEPNLRASSVVRYGYAIGEHLIALAHEVDFLTLPDTMIEEIYRCLLDVSPQASKSYVAGRLKEFHAFLVSGYGIPTLDWSEVIEDDLAEADAIDAGIVSLAEYTQALDKLNSNSGYSERDRLRFFTFLFFAYRFGLRTGEIARLAVSDVILRDGTMVVYIRNSSRGETKSDNGVRQLPLVGTLTKAEEELLTRWLAHVETFADGDPLATLLPTLSTHPHLIDRGACVSAVVAILREVTGNSQVRMRHLRHTCASRLFLAMIVETVPEGRLGGIYCSLWGNIAPEDVRQLLVGDSRVSRRGLYAMAMYMGHASPDVTHRHYIHLADIVLHEWILRKRVTIDDQGLAYAYQTSYANIRQLKSRAGSSATLPFFAQHFTRNSGIPSPQLVAPQQSDSNAMHTSANAPHLLSPADIDRLLTLATLRDSIDGLTDRFLTTVEVVAATLLAASEIQEKTGFTDFAVPLSTPGDLWRSMPLERYKTLEKEAPRAREFLAAIDERTVSIEKLKAMSTAWMSCYQPDSSHLLVSRRSEIDDLLDALTSIGISASDFEALLPEGLADSQTESSVKEWLLARGLSVRKKARLHQSFSKLDPESRIGLMLRPGDSHKLGYQRTLNRVLFVVSVWLRLHAATS